MQTIYKNKFGNDLFSQYTKAIIVGKGPTFQRITKPDENTLLMGVNQSVNELINPDMVLIQDVEFFANLKPKTIQVLKFVVTPEKIHAGLVKNATGLDWRKRKPSPQTVISCLENSSFNGIYIPYVSLNSHDGTFQTGVQHWSSGCRAVQFALAFMLNVKEITTYGIASGNSVEDAKAYIGHHSLFRDCSDDHAYHWGYRSQARKAIQNSVAQRGDVKLVMN